MRRARGLIGFALAVLVGLAAATLARGGSGDSYSSSIAVLGHSGATG